MAGGLSTDDLEQVWEALAQAIDQAGERRELFLAKLALLLAHEIGDRAAVDRLIRATLEDLA